MKIAVVTPYFDEPLDIIAACHSSVLGQSVACDHVLVADGQPRPEIDSWRARHIVMPKPHRDGGCTARFAGAVSAFNRGADAVAFLDADNLFLENHILSAVDCARTSGAAVVFADRIIQLADGTRCPFEDKDVVEYKHVDTSAFFITRHAIRLVVAWGMCGPELWPLCDRLALLLTKLFQLTHAWTGEPTFIYTSRWGLHYKAIGRDPPPDEHRVDWSSFSYEKIEAEIRSRFGIDVDPSLLLSSVHNVDRQNDGNIFSRLVRRSQGRGGGECAHNPTADLNACDPLQE